MSSELKVDTISEKTSAAGVTIDGVLIKDNVVNTDTISPKTTNGATLLEVPVKKLQTLTSSSGTLTVNAGLGSQGQITLTENISTIAFTNIPTSGVFEMVIYITQHASSAKTVSFGDITVNGGSSVKAETGGGSSLSMSSTVSATDRYEFFFVNAGTPRVNQTANYQSGFPHTDGEILRVDAGDSDSYSGSGLTWSDISGNGNHLTWTETPIHSNDYFTLDPTDRFYRTNFIQNVVSCYFVIQSNDAQSIFLSDNTSGSYYLAAFRSSNGYYNGGAGSPTAYVNTTTSTNLYSDFRSSSAVKLVTFTGMNCVGWNGNNMYLDAYTSFTWDSGKLYAFGCYSDTLTSGEVTTIYNYYKDNKGYIT